MNDEDMIEMMIEGEEERDRCLSIIERARELLNEVDQDDDE